MGCIENEYKTVTHTIVVMLTVNNKGQSSSDKYTNKRNQGKRTCAITIFTVLLLTRTIVILVLINDHLKQNRPTSKRIKIMIFDPSLLLLPIKG